MRGHHKRSESLYFAGLRVSIESPLCFGPPQHAWAASLLDACKLQQIRSRQSCSSSESSNSDSDSDSAGVGAWSCACTAPPSLCQGHGPGAQLGAVRHQLRPTWAQCAWAIWWHGCQGCTVGAGRGPVWAVGSRVRARAIQTCHHSQLHGTNEMRETWPGCGRQSRRPRPGVLG